MKFEKIAENKIKVTLTGYDLELLKIDYSHILYSTPEAHALFEDIMKTAKQEVDFDACDSTLVVEAVPISENGFVMVITKIAEGEFSFISSQEPVKKRRRVKAADVSLYKFESFEDVLQWASRKDAAYFKQAALYEMGNAYYLLCHAAEIDNKTRIIFKEYAKRQKDASLTASILDEHGTIVAKGNITKILKEYFIK